MQYNSLLLQLRKIPLLRRLRYKGNENMAVKIAGLWFYTNLPPNGKKKEKKVDPWRFPWFETAVNCLSCHWHPHHLLTLLSGHSHSLNPEFNTCSCSTRLKQKSGRSVSLLSSSYSILECHRDLEGYTVHINLPRCLQEHWKDLWKLGELRLSANGPWNLIRDSILLWGWKICCDLHWDLSPSSRFILYVPRVSRFNSTHRTAHLWGLHILTWLPGTESISVTHEIYMWGAILMPTP